MNGTRLIRLAVIAAGAFHVTVGAADVVTLSDGSRIIGVVEQLRDGKLILGTQFAGTLEIDASKVTRIETDRPVNVGMVSGDRLVGPIEWQPQIERAVVQTEMGGVPITADKIEAIWPKGGRSPEVLAMEEQIAKVRLEVEAARARWAATLEAGLLYQEGNNQIFNARGRGELRRTSAQDLLKFYLSGEYSEEHKRRSAHEVKAGAYYEYLLTPRWFAYSGVDLEYDEFENLNLRLSTSVGVGYYWLKRPAHELKTRAGLGYLHESYMDDVTADSAQTEIGLDYRLDIAPWAQLTHATTWYPTFESLRDYRLVSDTAVLFPLGKSEVWKLKLGALYEYNAIPRPGFKQLDQTYYANIVLDLK